MELGSLATYISACTQFYQHSVAQHKISTVNRFKNDRWSSQAYRKHSFLDDPGLVKRETMSVPDTQQLTPVGDGQNLHSHK